MMKNFTSMAKFAKNVMLAAFVAVGVQVANAQETTTSYEPVGANQWWMGEDVAKVNGSAYLFNVGAQIYATDNTAKETNIDNADLWTIKNGYTFTNQKTGKVFHMSASWIVVWIWSTAIQNNDASSFTLKAGKTLNKGKAYGLSIKPGRAENTTRYFSVSGTSYTADDQTTNSDWLFISATQKAAYDNYKKLFNELKDYLSNETVAKATTKVSEIEDVLADVSTKSNSYSTYNDTMDQDGNVVAKGDKSKLEDEIADVEKFIESATGIKNINATTSADVTAIYNLNGVRKNSLTKGINIVKTADGKVKKVLVK